MSRPAINSTKLNQNLILSERHPDSECHTNNWWLYDKRAYNGGGANIGMRTKSRDEAFIEAIEFWAKRAILAEQKYNQLKDRVDIFVSQFAEPEEERYED